MTATTAPHPPQRRTSHQGRRRAGSGAAPAPALAETGRFSPVRRRGRLGPFSVTQLVVLEVVAVAVLATLGRPVWLVSVVGTVGAVALLVVFGRRGGDWLYRHVALRRRFRTRARAALAARTTAPNPVVAELTVLAPGLTIRDIDERGIRIGIGRDGDGWFVGIALMPWTGASGQRGGTVTLDRLGRLLGESSMPVSAVQLVSHVVAAPTGTLDPAAPAVQSYLHLLGGADIPADQRVWLAVRLDPNDAAAASASRGGGVGGVDRALAAIVGRVGKTLQSAGIAHHVLDGEQLSTAVRTVAGLDGAAAPDAVAAGGPGAGERWTDWRGGESVSVCFLLTTWRPEATARLAADLGRAPLLSFTLSLMVRGRGLDLSGPDAARVEALGTRALNARALLRVAAAPDRMDDALTKVTEAAGRLGVGLRRLDGEHGPAVYAAAPTAAELAG